MIGVDTLYFWSWAQYASCISTLKVGCRQSIVQLRLGSACHLGIGIYTLVSVRGGWAVCKTARCHDWWRHCLPLVMESIHILQKYVESRMQTAYHSAASEKCLRGECVGRGKRWLWMCVDGRLGAPGHENTMQALTNGVQSGYQWSLKEHRIDTPAAITMHTYLTESKCINLL